MKIRRAMPVIVTDTPEETRKFYVDVLGFQIAMQEEGFLMLVSPSVPTTQLIVAWKVPGAFDPNVQDLTMSVEVDDVDAAYEEAGRQELEIVRPLTNEPWGMRRFFVREPGGAVVNVASHIADGEPHQSE